MARPLLRLVPTLAVFACLALAPAPLRAAGSEKELKQFQKAVEKDAANPANWFNLGLAQFKAEAWQEAATTLVKAAEMNPDSARYRFHAGEALAKAGKHEEAVAQYEAAIEKDPTMSAAHVNLGQAYLDSKRYEDAITAYKSALKNKPENPDALYNSVAEAYLRLGDMTQATKWFEKNVEARPNDPVAWFNIGVVYSRLGQKDQSFLPRAAEAFVKAGEFDPKDPQTLFMAGESLLFVGKKAEAKGWLQKYVAADPDGRKSGAQMFEIAKSYLADLK